MPERRQVPLTEPGDRPIIRSRPGGQPPKRHVIGAPDLDRPRRAHPDGVAVQQDPHHQPRIIRWATTPLGVGGPDPGQIQVLIDQLGDETCQMLGRQPVIQRRRQQQALTRIERPKRLVHRRFRRHIPRINPLRRIYRKQPILTSITSHTSSSRAHSHQPSTPPGVLLTHAPRPARSYRPDLVARLLRPGSRRTVPVPSHCRQSSTLIPMRSSAGQSAVALRGTHMVASRS